MLIEAAGLGKSYGRTRAVDDLSFTVEPGVVTGFLGPNGAGKSTTMRLMLGLDRGDGRTTFDGRPLAEQPLAPKVVGAHLDAKVFQPNRRARDHLRMLAAAADVQPSRVDEVIEQVGLASVARARTKTYSLGMAQRLGLAGAILAEPGALVLDEPANGLDPQSIHWLREFLRYYAQAGRAVLVSSHLLSEMNLLADRLVVIAQGRLIADESVADFLARSTRNDVLVRTTRRDDLRAALAADGIDGGDEGADGLSVPGATTDRVGSLAFDAGIPVLELTARTASLEQAFLELTGGTEQFHTSEPLPPAEPPRPADPAEPSAAVERPEATG